jgi:hypothetical protein
MISERRCSGIVSLLSEYFTAWTGSLTLWGNFGRLKTLDTTWVPWLNVRVHAEATTTECARARKDRSIAGNSVQMIDVDGGRGLSICRTESACPWLSSSGAH